MVDDDVGAAAYVDLVVVVLLAACVVAAVLASEAVPFASAIRLVVGVAILTFLPGYAVVTALYPKTRPDTGHDGDDTRPPRGDALTAVERLVLSVPTSLVLAALVALASNFVPGGIGAEPVVVGLGTVTLVAAAVAVGRRLQVPSESRSGMAPGSLAASLRRGIGHESVGMTLLNVTVVASVVVALVVVAVQPFGAPASRQFSEYQLLTEREDGDRVAADYPSQFDGEDESLFVRIQNNEGRSVNYGVVVKLQRMNETGEDLRSTRTLVLDRFSVRVDAGEAETIEHSPSPSMTGTVRLVYLFYKGEVPEDPTRETADGALHLWIDVTDRAADDSGSTPDGETAPPR